MQGIKEVRRLIYIIDAWCDCGKLIRMEGNNEDFTCPHCGATYGILPVRVDGE